MGRERLGSPPPCYVTKGMGKKLIVSRRNSGPTREDLAQVKFTLMSYDVEAKREKLKKEISNSLQSSRPISIGMKSSNFLKMAAEKAFPSPSELEVASALLLLSTTMAAPLDLISLEPEKSCEKERMVMNDKSSKRLSVSRSDWSVSSSSITSDNQQSLEVITMVTDMAKLKVVRKRRSRNFWISDCRKISSGFPKTKAEASASVSSCLSNSSSSAVSSARSRDVIRKREHYPLLTQAKDSKPKTIFGSGHMRRRAEAILKVLAAYGSVSEVRIRQLLGDSPSTSKALRILLNLEQVKRTGEGGRGDPYIYEIA